MSIPFSISSNIYAVNLNEKNILFALSYLNLGNSPNLKQNKNLL
jgi:hypothetical protein